MDLSNKPRHTYRELVRLRSDVARARGIRDYERKVVVQDVLALKDHGVNAGVSLHSLADELAREAISQPSNLCESHSIPGEALGSVLSFKNLLKSVSSVGQAGPAREFLFDGQSIEHFENGSQMLKNALGCVQEVRSPWGERICFSYDSSGNLDAFTRVDRWGSLQSQGCREKQGVVVRNSQGRVYAVGVSMAVSPRGRLTIHNAGGQFLAVDLVQQVHIERHILDYLDKSYSAVTGVFAYDGFRLATVFQ
ncbi:MAG: hypothetical protein HY711_06210, partial [Candidatus Melainabacteria bacterium]|nr:hypothetical protein [Candidatus Melainabacteria bacterium]